MKKNLEPFLKAAKTHAELAQSLIDSGVRSVSSVWKGGELFGSLSALSVEGDLERDESHYLLVPNEKSAQGYSLFSKRVVPAGHGNENSLPKVRVFHLPDRSTLALLESSILEVEVSREVGSDNQGDSQLAERLESLGREIDEETTRLSGGLLFVGGVLTVLNPLLGVGMIAGSLFPAIGGKLAKAGGTMAADSLQSFQKERKRNKARKVAIGDLRRLKPEVFENPLLKQLGLALAESPAFQDPLLQMTNPMDGFPNHRYFQVSLEAISEIYREQLKERKTSLPVPLQSWIRHLGELRDV